MKTAKKEEEKDFQKIDKFTRNFIIVCCVILGSIFLAACAYMIKLIASEPNQVTNEQSNYNVQQINLVNM